MKTRKTVQTIYLAGPMSGIADHNRPAFNVAAESLREQGYNVVNPADFDTTLTAPSWICCMVRDIPHVCSADAVAVLPGWEQSDGAKLEVFVATKLGKPVYRISVATGPLYDDYELIRLPVHATGYMTSTGNPGLVL